MSKLHPVYPESQGISSLWFLHAMKKKFLNQEHIKI